MKTSNKPPRNNKQGNQLRTSTSSSSKLNNTVFDTRRRESGILGMAEPSNQDNNSESEYKAGNMQNETNYTNSEKGERVKVAVRVRPLQPHELQRNDKTCVQCIDNNNIVLTMPGGSSK